jgi:hypothetical protein
MVFNGHTQESIDEIDEETLTDITVMYADGLLGNKAIYNAISPLTAVVFNYFRDPSKSSAYKADDIFPWIVEYSKDPDEEKVDTANQALLTFLTNAPNFKMERFENGSLI